jgi:hypothetical protein
MHSITVPGVWENNPYNEAGVLGAHNRISNGLRHVHAPEQQETLVSKGIGNCDCCLCRELYPT